MRRFISTTLIFVLLFSTFTFYTSHGNYVEANGDNATDLIVSAEKLYLREGPGLSYPIITTLSEGQELGFVEKQGDWYHVSYQNHEGWVASWLTSTSEKEQTTHDNQIAVSQVDYLNLRAEPSITSPVLSQLSMGDEAQILQQQDSWVQIQYNGTLGWVSSDYISINENNSMQETITTSGSDSDLENDKESSTSTVEIDPESFTIIVDAVNIRKKADLSSKKIGVAKKGEQFKVLQRNNNWVQIQIGKQKGWVYSFYGSFTINPNLTSASDSNESSSSNENYVTIIYNGTNLRNAPSTSADVVVLANAGERYKIVAAENDWYEIEVNESQTAYVANWVVSMNGGNELTADSQPTENKEKRKKGTLKGVTIVVDPGHGGNDVGTTGVRGTEEKDITLKTVELLKSKLRAAGAEVILTRESDVYVDLRKRVSISHQYNADAFISIHYDATEDSSISGFTTYYMNDYQQPLAEYVHNGLAQKADLRDRGVQPGNYLVLRENKQNAILIELGYLSNPNEERIVTTDYYREQATLGIYQGILNYFDSQLE